MAKDFQERIEEANQRVTPTLEHMLGIGLMQFNQSTNSAARKIMWGTHAQHRLNIINGEKAIVETGYEIRFGDLSSTITKTDNNYRVAAKISKFSFSPNHHYYLIMEDPVNKKLDVVERISYKHITESYGYLYNNEYMDSVQVGQMIPKDTILQKSLAFDEYMNRKDGRNFNVAYMALDKNMEDSIIYSDAAAKYMSAPLIKPVKIMINENDIPLNLYGTDDVYKCIPDIGEDVKDSVLIALRKEKKDEAVYTQSVERLRKTTMSDDKYTLIGKVVDVNVYCNNPDNLEGYYNAQFKMYYNENQRMCTQLVSTVTQYIANGYKLSYELEKMFGISKRVMNHDQYIDKRLFSNLIVEIVVLEERELQAGDKTSNRYGGKGVVSSIIPQKLMPRIISTGEYVDVILNSNGIYGRENPGQLFELSITHIGCEIVQRIKKGQYTVDKAFELITKYIEFISPPEADSMRGILAGMSQDEKQFFLESIINDGAIHISAKPISEAINIDQLNEMYKAFPWVTQQEIEVPMKDSNGDIRYLKARRPIVVGRQYTFRLKQYAEEKFSATSLSATNIKNENTKSKASKDFRELYSNTPIRFGNMETNDLNHLGAGYIIQNLMIHSLSPHARRLTEQMYTANPFSIDIRLDDDSSNRSAEIANTYLKTVGRRLIFEKRPKFKHKITFSPISFVKDPIKRPFFFVKEKNFDFEKDWNDRQELKAKIAKDKNVKPVFKSFEGVDRKVHLAKYYAEREHELEVWEKQIRDKKLKEKLNNN